MKKQSKTTRRHPRFETLENRNLLATFSGLVFNDTDGSGVQNGAETPISGWTVYLDSNRNTIADADEPTTVTLADGSYQLTTPTMPPTDPATTTSFRVGALLPVAETSGRWLNTNTNYDYGVISSSDPANKVVTFNFGFQFVPFSTFAPLGGESLVNQTTVGQQQAGGLDDRAHNVNAIAADKNGNYAVAWLASDTTTTGQVYVRVFNADGTARTSEIKVADATRSSLGNKMPLVAMSQDGTKFVVSWDNYVEATGMRAPFAQLYNAATGNPIGSRQQVVPYSSKQAFEVQGLVMDGDGDFAVLIGDFNAISYKFQRYTNQGVASGKSVACAIQTRATGLNGLLINGGQAIAMDSAGNLVVTWAEMTGIYAQRYNASSSLVGSKITLITNVDSSKVENIKPNVAMNAAGRFVITWSTNISNSATTRGLAKVFEANGALVGGPVTFSSWGYNSYKSALGMDSSGNATIAFYRFSTHNGIMFGGSTEILVRRLSSAGVLSETQAVTSTTEGLQAFPSLAASDSGFIVAWSGRGTGDDDGVFAQRYTTVVPAPTAMRSATVTTTTTATSTATASVYDAALVDYLASSNEDTLLAKRRGLGMVVRSKP